MSQGNFSFTELMSTQGRNAIRAKVKMMYKRHHHRAGFSLIEILFVAAVLGILAGIAIFSAQEFYESNRRKTVFDEVKSIGTGLSFAQDDIGFIPKIHMLNEPKTLVTTIQNGITLIRPGFDTYGFLPSDGAQAIKVNSDWSGPYMPIVTSRKALAQGQAGLVKMRILSSFGTNLSGNPDQVAGDSLVDWPTDVWGNPYVVYQISSDEGLIDFNTNPQGWRFIRAAQEKADRVFVCSYGENRVPGGGLDFEGLPVPRPGTAVYNRLLDLRLYVDGDVLNQGAQYTLREANSTIPAADLYDSQFLDDFPSTIKNPNYDPQDSYIEGTGAYGQIGILDQGTDDVVFAF